MGEKKSKIGSSLQYCEKALKEDHTQSITLHSTIKLCKCLKGAYRDVDMMAYLSKLFLQWIVSGKKECLCMSVLQEGNGKIS